MEKLLLCPTDGKIKSQQEREQTEDLRRSQPVYQVIEKSDDREKHTVYGMVLWKLKTRVKNSHQLAHLFYYVWVLCFFKNRNKMEILEIINSSVETTLVL